jgi:hypothetical protein
MRRKSALFGLATLAASTASLGGCGTHSEPTAPPVPADPPQPVAGLINAPLGESECAQGEPDARITGVGVAQSGTGYGSRLACPEGYLVDLDNYALAAGGTLLIYSGPNEGGREACENTVLTAYVWEKDLVSGQYRRLRSYRGSDPVSERGRFVEGLEGEGVCERPHVILDLEYPEFLPGGDYRIGFNTSRTAGGRTEFGDTTLATAEPAETPSSDLAEAERLIGDDAALAQFARDSRVVGGSHEVSCRLAELEWLILEQVAPGLSALGVTAATSSGYVAARKRAFDTYCGDTFSSQDFERVFGQATREVAQYYVQVVNEIVAHLGTDPSIAAGLLESSLTDLSAQLTRNCTPDRAALDNFVATGAVPGLADTRLGALSNSLFGACSGGGGVGGSVGANAQEMANQIASGQGLGGTFRACINDVLAKELDDSKCSDPRAQLPTPLDEETIAECMKRDTDAAQQQCITEAQKKREREMNPEGGDESEEEQPETGSDFEPYTTCEGLEGIEQTICEDAKARLDGPALMGPEEILAVRGATDNSGLIWGGIKKVFSWVLGPIKHLTQPLDIPIKAGAGALEGVTKVHEAELRRTCDIFHHETKCKGLHRLREGHKRCVGEQFGDALATYTSMNEAANFGTQPMTVFDRMNACYCDYLGQPVFGQDCMSADERERQSCLDAPLGPDDGPRRECYKYLVSGDIAPSAMHATYCHYMMPDPNCTGVIGADGGCACAESVPPGEIDDAIGRETCGTVYCDPLAAGGDASAVFDVRTGCCQQVTGPAPSVPGPNPVCISDTVNPRELWLGFDSDAVLPALATDLTRLQVDTRRDVFERDLSLYRAGYTSAVGPLVARDSFPELRALNADDLNVMLDVEVLRPQDTACERSQVQVFCNSELMNNELLGETSLMPIAPGAFSELRIPIARSNVDRCLPESGSSARLAFAVDSCDGDLRTGLGAYTFTRETQSAWIEAIELEYCPGDSTALQQIFEINVSPTTTGLLNIYQP